MSVVHVHVHACVSMQDLWGLGAYFPSKFRKIGCSEIASEIILGKKQSCSSYMVCRVLHLVFSCISFMHGHLPSQLTLNFLERR